MNHSLITSLEQRGEKSEKSVDELADQRKAFALIGLRDLVTEGEGVVEIGEDVLNHRHLDQLDAAFEMQVKAAVI